MPTAIEINAASGGSPAVASSAPKGSGTPKFHRLAVREVRRESADAVSLTFEVPAPLAADFAFAPGQYLTLKATLEGEEIRRSYSICSGPDDGEMRIAVKQVEGGVFSTFINESLKAGDHLDVMTPTGRFGLEHARGNARIHVAFAAGSGITPVLSIARGVLAREPDSRFFLFYGNRSTDNILFRTELEELKDRFLGRLSVFHVLSREQQDLAILNGHLDGEKVRLLLTAMVPAAAVDHAFVCGPTAMIDELETTLSDLGLPKDKVHVERFVSALGGKPRPRPVMAPDAAPAHVASLIVDGKRRDVPVAQGEAILDAALRAGMDLPFACKGGMCSTCRAKVVEGSTEMEVNYSLEPWELEAGFILTCQARPTSARVVVDFDQV
ncbi:1,2-phenylacetyl-CoA epoxidase subunit PaaE [Xanthobacter oligotrophicus]|uniref:1,2-phenylacetyl-CoA epoxidase subunit PaaE n=1 Tax=Xanthobacter oligotrophicus TaxID=2607286 RepID=UPI001E57C873|nr:1,2-phenylacetyl-CoA epoxidase subunit PaaE [Xanthobacter oligotrophicus]MCG5235768.1 phenylacetate-CoA oxygenase/reductase subunit PaaK [Xanthobacter oligotrophicus]